MQQVKRFLGIRAFEAGIGLLSFILLASTSFASDGGKEFTLHNQTGKEIKQVDIGPINSDSFGEDIVIEPMANNASGHIAFRSSAVGNEWEMRIGFADGSSSTWT